jgi:lysophospholipase L1-like esterase
MGRRGLWPFIGLGTTLLTLGLLVGFMIATSPTASKSPLAPQPSETVSSKRGITIVGLGDSLTRGYGDDTGKGYIGYAKQYIQTSLPKVPVAYANFAVSGSVTNDVIRQLNNEPGILDSIRKSDYVFLTIAGNDLNKRDETVNSQQLALSRSKFNATLQNLKAIFDKISKTNPAIQILYVGLYNPYENSANGAEIGKSIQTWNFEVAKLALLYKQVRVVQSYDLFQDHVDAYLWDDHYHPNTAGYKVIAMRISQLVEADQR